MDDFFLVQWIRGANQLVTEGTTLLLSIAVLIGLGMIVGGIVLLVKASNKNTNQTANQGMTTGQSAMAGLFSLVLGVILAGGLITYMAANTGDNLGDGEPNTLPTYSIGSDD